MGMELISDSQNSISKKKLLVRFCFKKNSLSESQSFRFAPHQPYFLGPAHSSASLGSLPRVVCPVCRSCSRNAHTTHTLVSTSSSAPPQAPACSRVPRTAPSGSGNCPLPGGRSGPVARWRWCVRAGGYPIPNTNPETHSDHLICNPAPLHTHSESFVGSLRHMLFHLFVIYDETNLGRSRAEVWTM